MHIRVGRHVLGHDARRTTSPTAHGGRALVAVRGLVVTGSLLVALAACGGSKGTPTPAPAVSPGVAVRDSFTRTVAQGWGQPDAGQAWVMNPTSQGATSVDGSTGLMTLAPGGVFADAPVSAADVDVTARWMLDALPVTDPVTIHLWPRTLEGTDEYRFYLAVDPQGDVTAHFAVTAGGTTTPLGSGAKAGPAYAAGAWWHVRVTASGTSPTTLHARAWKDGSPEPATWDLEVTDSTPSVQADSRSVKVGIYSSTVSDPPLRLSIDDLEVETSGRI